MLSMLAIALLGNAQQSSCRVTPRPVQINEARPLASYEGDSPLTHFKLELCVASFLNILTENLLTWAPGLSKVTEADTLFTFSFDPTFATVIGGQSFTLQHSNVTNLLAPYDGALDYQGDSGFTYSQFKQNLITIEDDVTPSEAKFFAGPVTLFVKVTSPNGVSIQHSGMVITSVDQLASIGATLFYNPVEVAP